MVGGRVAFPIVGRERRRAAGFPAALRRSASFGESKLYEDPPGPLSGVGLIAACSYLVAASNHLPVEMDARHRCMDARSEVAVSTTSLEIKISLRIGRLPSVGTR